MTTTGSGVGQRLLAAMALLAGVGFAAVALHGLWGDVWRLVLGSVLALLVLLFLWVGLTRSRLRRTAALGLAAVALLALVAVVVTGPRPIEALAMVGLAALAVGCTRRAVPITTELVGEHVGPARHPVLIVNPRSGDGKAARAHLATVAAAQGIEVVVLEPGTDLGALAEDAVARGADVLGMAGGDGSQALVAAIAAAHDVAHVCVPAGTRNHLALDLGLDREDLLAALGAFADGALERRIDLATVNGRTFVNNVSLGVYARIVQEPGYREAKAKTTADLLPTLIGPDAEPFDLHVLAPDGHVVHGAQVIQVSNDRYELERLDPSFGRRAALDRGRLGVAVAKVERDLDVTRFVVLEAAGRIGRFEGLRTWEAAEVEITSGSPVPAGVDGEAMVLDPPLRFRSHPSALRVRLPAEAPGVLVPREDGLPGVLRDLVAVAAGRA